MSWEGLVMTLNKSLFNIGIFKNTVYRFKWGSLLYFVALFFSVPFMLLVADFERLAERIIGSSYYIPTSIILRSDYLIFPLILAVAVPTIAAVLVFNNIHSSKQGIFTHGLPVDRCTSYISNLAAAFALMATPVLANGIILMLMSFGKYGQLMTSMSVIYWTGLNLNMLFVMFSVAAFSAFLTGNIAAHIGINIFFHLIPMLVGWTIILISGQFLYGFYQADNFIANELISNSPIVWLFGRSLSVVDAGNAMPLFAKLQTWLYILGAVVMYIFAYILYKKRKIEACGDVAAFKVFKPILKYAVVAGVAIAVFGILVSMNMGAFAMFVVAATLTAITYFAAEMLMNKSFKIFKTSYKGYLGFLVCCAVFIGFFAYTDVFGYETRIPKPEEIAEAGVPGRWSKKDELIFDDPQLIDDTIAIHQEIISDIPVRKPDVGENRYMGISYKLKNGKQLHRRYWVSEELYSRAMTDMYRSTEYKLSATGLADLNIESVDRLSLEAGCSGFSYTLTLNKDSAELLQAIVKDIEELSYTEIEKSYNVLNLSIAVDCTAEENERLKYFKNSQYDPFDENSKYTYMDFRLDINSNFKNALAFLKEKGYYDKIISELGQSLNICKKPFFKEGDIFTYKGDMGTISEFAISSLDCIDIEAADEKKLAELILSQERTISDGQSYLVLAGLERFVGDIRATDYSVAISAEDLPEYLKKYVEE